MRRGGSEEQCFSNPLKGHIMSDPTPRIEDGTAPAGVPPAPPEAHPGAVASEVHAEQAPGLEQGGEAERGGALEDEGEADHLGTATYSPEDNKLRLYPFARLSRPDYERVKAAGFSWAPKQELFVAPMWTPSRAALLVALCGEIGDEDRSLLERAEDRADRFEGYSERRGQEAEAARRQVEAITEHIPLGQPILVGHHSERRARKDAERIQDGMRRAVRLWDTRDYWERRARAAKDHADYKQQPAVRYRRLKGIEADLRKSHRIVEEAQAFLKLWRTPGLSQEQAVAIAGRDSVRVVEKGKAWGTSAYDLLTRAEPKPLAEVVALAIRFHESRIAHQQPWIVHYEHRIAYERALLEEGGGLVAETQEIQVGGQVRIGDDWLTVVRVNRKAGRAVSVTTNTRYVRVRGIEEVEAYRPPSDAQAAAVKAARKLPPLANYAHAGAVEMSKAAWDGTHKDYKGTREAGQGARYEGGGPRDVQAVDLSRHGLHRVRVVVHGGSLRSVFITDAKVVQPPKAAEAKAKAQTRAAVPAPVAVAPAQDVARPSASVSREGAESIEAMRRTLQAGGAQAASAPQLYPTPMVLAQRMVALAAPRLGERVLEPSAGSGNLLRVLPGVIRERVPVGTVRQSVCDVVAVELNGAFKESLANEGLAQRVVGGDFLACTPEDLGLFHVILMNPPFANAADIAHIRHACEFLAPGGRLVALCADGPRQREQLATLGKYEPLPEGSFASVGTQVRVALLVIRA